MNALAIPAYRTRQALIRYAVLCGVLLCLVAASQLGMLWLAAMYLREGRLASITSPEAVLGALAIAFAILVIRVRFPAPSGVARDPVFFWLAGFLAIAAAGELLRPEQRLGNVTTFMSIGAYYLVGVAIGQELVQRDGRIPILPGLLAVYTIWYAALLVFYLRDDLGFYGQLPGSDLARLEFRQGFTATELPIYVGFQFPVLIYAARIARSPAVRVWAVGVMVPATLLVIATWSSAALFALFLVVLVFFVSRSTVDWRAVVRSVVLAVAAIAAIAATSQGLVNSLVGKLQDFAVGEGVRALIYADLVRHIVDHPLGIGKGRFVETNSFSWLGEGVYPHQNLLGIGAELGIPALLLFVGFLVAVLLRLVRVAFRRTADPVPGRRLLGALVLSLFVYQQFRGLFQDTWVIRETYLWLGIAGGAITGWRLTVAASGSGAVPQ